MPEQYHKEAHIASFSEGKHLAQLLVKMEDTPGALADVNALMASEGVDIRQSASYSDQSGKFGIFNAFVCFTKKDYSSDQLVKKLKSSPKVLSVLVEDGVDGSVVDTLTFPLRFSSERGVLFMGNALVQMFGAIESVFGSGGSVIIYQQGRNYGRALTKDLAKILTKDYMVKHYSYGISIIAAMGWGVAKVEKADDALTSLVIRVDDSVVCPKPGTEKRSGYFLAGALAGVFSFLSGKELQGRESKCASAGDPYCEFLID